jgi:hypothetical protein
MNEHTAINNQLALEEEREYWQEKVNYTFTKALELLLRKEKENYLSEQKLNTYDSQKKELTNLNNSLKLELSTIEQGIWAVRKEQEKYSGEFRRIAMQKDELERKNVEIFEEVSVMLMY